MIKILCVGKIKERFFTDGIAEYEKSLNAFTKFSIVEVKEVNTFDINKNITPTVTPPMRSNHTSAIFGIRRRKPIIDVIITEIIDISLFFMSLIPSIKRNTPKQQTLIILNTLTILCPTS